MKKRLEVYIDSEIYSQLTECEEHLRKQNPDKWKTRTSIIEAMILLFHHMNTAISDKP